MAKEGLLQIKDILEDYTDDIQQAITNEAQRIAKEGAKDLKNTRNTYKIRTGKYNKGWTVKTTKGRNFVECIIHNKDNYQLTHLLERGHEIVDRNGHHKGRVRAYKHIEPVDKKRTREYERAVEMIIRNGG